jgi:hypothetical protein
VFDFFRGILHGFSPGTTVDVTRVAEKLADSQRNFVDFSDNISIYLAH